MSTVRVNAIGTVRTWWQARVPRERSMLALMFMALAAFVYWYALLEPMRGLRDRARAGSALASNELSVVAADAARIEALRRQRPPAPQGEALPAAILASARQAGVAIARHRTGSDAALEIGIDAVDAPALLDWLDALGDDPGIAPARISVDKANGRLVVDAAFVAPVPDGSTP